MQSYLFWILYIIVISLPFSIGQMENIRFVAIGSTTLLECRFQKTTKPLYWRGPTNLTLYSIDGVIDLSLPKAERLSIETKTGKYNLAVMNFTKNDAGRYRCDTVVNGRPMTQDVRVEIPEPPRNMTISNVTSLKTIQLTAGYTTILKCSIEDGKPASTVSLVLADTLLNSSTKGVVCYTLVVSRYHHMKTLICTASNGYYSQQKQIQLQVNFSLEVKMIVQQSYIKEGENVTLICEYLTIIKPVIIKWLKEGCIIRSADKNHLRLSNVTRHDSGRYSCQVRNRVETGTDSVDLAIHYKPYLKDQKSLFTISSEVDQPSYISFLVMSETKPEVSWTKSAGGKTGYWKITPQPNYTFSISSTILPYTESQIDLYGVRIRNHVGAIGLVIDLARYITGTYPERLSCNMSTVVEISCNISFSGEKIANIWQHEFGHKAVRNITGLVTENVSVLKIRFCDYRDAGTYICKWITPFGVYTSSSKVTVYDQPILIKQSALQTGKHLILEVMFYSTPEPMSATWYYNDNIFSKDNNISFLNMTPTIVNITVYKTVVRTKGYVATLTVFDYIRFNILKFDCQIENAFGYLDISFNHHNSARGTTIPPANNENTTSDTGEKRGVFVYGGIAIVLLVVIMIVTFTIYRLLKVKAHERNLQTDQIQRDNMVPQDESARNSLSLDNNPFYEEIDSVHYQSVEWRNYSFAGESDPTFRDNSDSNLVVPLHYNGLSHEEEYKKYNEVHDDLSPGYLDVIC